MMLQYFENIVSGIQGKLDQDPDSPNPRKRYTQEIARLGARLYSGKQKVAWCGVAAPFDLLNAMGVTSCFVEFVGGVLSSMESAGPMLERAEQEGYGTDGCAYHRTVMGAAHNGLMPEPDFLIATTCPCSGGVAAIENLASHFKKDLFVLQVPAHSHPRSIEYLASQLQEMVQFVAHHTGQPLRQEKLQQAVEQSNRARRLMQELFALATQVPSPVQGKDLRNFGVVMALFLGTEAAVQVARAFRDEFQARIESGRGGVPEEKLRLLWLQNRIQFKNPLLDVLEKEYRTSIVIDELNDITWDPIDPSNPYPAMAQRMISFPFNGAIEHRLEHMKDLARRYRVDGVVNPCHWGCRQGPGARGLISEGLKEIGLPVLNLEVDCVDSRNFSWGQVKTRLEAFLELMQNQTPPFAR